VEQAKAARRVIVTCEEIVDADFLRRDSNRNQIPFFHVDAVVPVPHGAYPTACYRHYDYDPFYLTDYRKAAADDTRHRAYLEKYIYGVDNHSDFLALIGQSRLDTIAADPVTGYAVGLDRR